MSPEKRISGSFSWWLFIAVTNLVQGVRQDQDQDQDLRKMNGSGTRGKQVCYDSRMFCFWPEQRQNEKVGYVYKKSNLAAPPTGSTSLDSTL